MINEVEKHFKNFASDNETQHPNPKCKVANLVLICIMAFKNHAANLHKISLCV